MKMKLLFLYIFFLLFVIVFSGCFENYEDNKELTVNQIIANIIKANKNITSYKYKINITNIRTIFNNSETNDTKYSTSVNASVDVINHSLIYL